MRSGTHIITSDNEGNRTNTKIDYKKKPPNTLRVVAIGGSTTMDGVTDDDKIWTNLLAKKLTSLTMFLKQRILYLFKRKLMTVNLSILLPIILKYFYLFPNKEEPSFFKKFHKLWSKKWK